MGASLDYRTYKTDNTHEIKAAFKRDREAAAEDDELTFGSEEDAAYSGSISTLGRIGKWINEPRANEDEAVSELGDRHQKWSDALAIAFYLPGEKTEAQKKAKESAKAKLKDAEDNFRKVCLDVRAAFASTKSKTVGCKACGSSFNRDLLAKKQVPLRCLLCDDDLLSATARKRIVTAKEKKRAAQDALNAARAASTSKKVGYVVGGWCPS